MGSEAAIASLLSSGKLRHGVSGTRPAAPTFGLDELAGRLVELTGGAALTVATALLLEAQRRREPVAWIAPPDAVFFPPDLAATGVDLASLAVVRVAEVAAALRAADHLLRSGAFGLVAVDLSHAGRVQVPLAAQVRLAGLAKRHDAVLAVLTREPGGVTLASLRAAAAHRRLAGARFELGLRVTKDKRRSAPWQCTEVLRGPMGLR